MSRLTLWLRAGADDSRPNGDPSAHHIFFLMLHKGSVDDRLKFDVKTVNESRPPREFKEVGLRKTPALQLSEDEALSHEDEILEELENYLPRRNSLEEAAAAEAATADIFRHFAFFIKEVNKDSKGLNTELLRIDEYLSSCGTKFLLGNELSYLDCLLLPRLYTIRVAAKALKNYSIPSELIHLRDYMGRGFRTEVFRVSCPCDQEIILFWSNKPDTPKISSQKQAQLARETPSFSYIAYTL